MKAKVKAVSALLLAAAVALVAVVGLQGCKPEQLKDGYQFGDGTKIVLEAVRTIAHYRYAYCVEGNQGVRSLLISAVRAWEPDYPEAGICSDAGELAANLAAFLGSDAEGVRVAKPDD